MRHLVGFGLIAISSFAAGSCMGDDGSTPPDETVNCDTITDKDEFTIGLTKTGDAGLLNFSIVSGDPAPPIRGDNTWVIDVTAQAGAAPITDAQMTVKPFMPAHQHGAGKTVVVEPMPTAGQYQLSPINLWMPGVWETTINVTSATGTDKVVFKFCINS